jgi:hypothetical protein
VLKEKEEGGMRTLEEMRALGESLRDVDWEGAGRVHDWRNYVPDEVRALWRGLASEARGVAHIIAQDAADAEEWD